MKIEVGKSYRTRDRRKAEVLFIGTKPVMYPVIYDAGRGFYEACTLNGRQNLLGMESHADLISEWSDPTPFEKALAEWRARYHPEAVTDFFWNAALDHAIHSVVSHSNENTLNYASRICDDLRKEKV